MRYGSVLDAPGRGAEDPERKVEPTPRASPKRGSRARFGAIAYRLFGGRALMLREVLFCCPAPSTTVSVIVYLPGIV